MPKGRHSAGMSASHGGGGHSDGPGGGGGGIGAGGGGYAPGGNGVEPQAINTAPRQVVVEGFSRTRHQTEPLTVTFTGTGGAGRVTSVSGHEYETTPDSCTCPDFRIRHRECRHIRALRQAMGIGALHPDQQTVANTASHAVSQTTVDQSHQHDEDMRDRLARLSAIDADTRFISDDQDLWQQYMNTARETAATYETENVLDGPEGNTFGVELEFVGGDREAIARDLYRAGLIPRPEQIRYHGGLTQDPTKWRFERDATVDGEVVSPIMRDTPEHWAQLQQVCEIVRRHGGSVNSRCGGHVHIGKEPLDDNRYRKDRLLRIVQGFEDIYYRIAASGELQGEHRGFTWAAPISRNWNERLPRDNDAAERRIGSGTGEAHRNMINSRSHTIEFRMFNGSLTPEQIQANVKLAYNTVRAAATVNRETEQGRFVPTAPRPVGTGRQNGVSDDDPSVRQFLDLVFTRGKDKVSALRQFLGSHWQSNG